MTVTALPQRNIDFSILDEEKIETIHRTSIRLLETLGMKVGGERGLTLFREAGCEIDENSIVKIPSRLVEEALESAPKTLHLYTRDGELNMTIDSSNPVYFGTHADQLEYVDPETGKVRAFLKRDTQIMCRLADALPNIHFILSVGMSKDVRPDIQTQISFIETVKHFSKTINFSTNDIGSLQEVIDIAAMVAGGLDKLQEKPFIFNYCEPIPPLTHPVESTEKLIISAQNRIPVVYMPYCMMGGTAPMSFGATLTQCNAEILTGLVLSQLAAKGAPLIYGAMPSIMDMKTTIGSYGATEFHLLVAAASQMANHYDLPFYGTAGCTDAKFLDEQAVAESTMEIFSTLLSRANLIHDVGVSDHCNSVNPELVVLCDELIEMLKHYTRGVTLEDEDRLMEIIGSSGHGGAYLHTPHTMKHFKDIHYSTLFSREMKNPDHSMVREKIRKKIRNIQENHQAPPLSPNTVTQLDKWALRLSRAV